MQKRRFCNTLSIISVLTLSLLSVLLLPVCLFALPVLDQGQSAASQIQSFRDLPAGAAPAIVKKMLKDLPEEYQLQENENTFSMSNPSHGLHIAFTAEGPHITSGGSSWGMTMSGIGYEDSVKPVQEAMLINDEGRMVYERGLVSEWYVISRWGIEQGFTI